MEIHIRRLIPNDLDEVMEIEPVAFGSHHWSRQSFLNELTNPSGFYFAAVAEGTLLGYSGFWLIGDEAHITTLAVHPDLRRNYIGESLLINDIEHALDVGAKRLTLEVRASNDVAQKLYGKYGFKELGKRRKYYQDNDEDALVLWAEITAEFKILLSKQKEGLAGKGATAVPMVLPGGELSEKSQNG
jgi:ribosomal-protein-alanine N-acetyltransferase